MNADSTDDDDEVNNSSTRKEYLNEFGVGRVNSKKNKGDARSGGGSSDEAVGKQRYADKMNAASDDDSSQSEEDPRYSSERILNHVAENEKKSSVDKDVAPMSTSSGPRMENTVNSSAKEFEIVLQGLGTKKSDKGEAYGLVNLKLVHMPLEEADFPESFQDKQNMELGGAIPAMPIKLPYDARGPTAEANMQIDLFNENPVKFSKTIVVYQEEEKNKIAPFFRWIEDKSVIGENQEKYRAQFESALVGPGKLVVRLRPISAKLIEELLKCKDVAEILPVCLGTLKKDEKTAASTWLPSHLSRKEVVASTGKKATTKAPSTTTKAPSTKKESGAKRGKSDDKEKPPAKKPKMGDGFTQTAMTQQFPSNRKKSSAGSSDSTAPLAEEDASAPPPDLDSPPPVTVQDDAPDTSKNGGREDGVDDGDHGDHGDYGEDEGMLLIDEYVDMGRVPRRDKELMDMAKQVGRSNMELFVAMRLRQEDGERAGVGLLSFEGIMQQYKHPKRPDENFLEYCRP